MHKQKSSTPSGWRWWPGDQNVHSACCLYSVFHFVAECKSLSFCLCPPFLKALRLTSVAIRSAGHSSFIFSPPMCLQPFQKGRKKTPANQKGWQDTKARWGRGLNVLILFDWMSAHLLHSSVRPEGLPPPTEPPVIPLSVLSHPIPGLRHEPAPKSWKMEKCRHALLCHRCLDVSGAAGVNSRIRSCFVLDKNK